jgi:hypothetical protein
MFWMSLVPLFWVYLQYWWWRSSLKMHWFKSGHCFCGMQRFIVMFAKCCHLTQPWVTWIQSPHSYMIQWISHTCLPIIWSLPMHIMHMDLNGWVVGVSYARWHLLWSSQVVKCHMFFSQHCSVLHCWWHISSWIIDASQICSINIEWICDLTVFLLGYCI